MIKSVYVNANRNSVKPQSKPVKCCHKCQQPGHFAARCPTRQASAKPAKERNNHVASRASAQRRTRSSKNAGAVAQELIKGAERAQGECDALRERVHELEDVINSQTVDNHQNRGQGSGSPAVEEGNGEEADNVRLPPALEAEIRAAIEDTVPAVPDESQQGDKVIPPGPKSDSKGGSDKPAPTGPWEWWSDPENTDLANLARDFQFSWHENLVAWQLVKSYFTFTNCAVSLLMAIIIAPGIFHILKSLFLSFIMLFLFNVCFIYIRNHSVWFTRRIFRDLRDHWIQGATFLLHLNGSWDFYFFKLYTHRDKHLCYGAGIFVAEILTFLFGLWSGSSLCGWVLEIFMGVYFGSERSVSWYLSVFSTAFRLVGGQLFPNELAWMAPFLGSVAWKMASLYFTIAVTLAVTAFWIFGIWQVGVLLITALQIRTARFAGFVRQRSQSDMRAHTFKNQDLQDQNCPFRVQITLTFMWMTVSTFETTVSAMMMAELVSHKYNRPGSNLKDTMDRIYHACAATGSINIDKLGYFVNDDVAGETARLALAWSRSRYESIERWGSGF